MLRFVAGAAQLDAREMLTRNVEVCSPGAPACPETEEMSTEQHAAFVGGKCWVSYGSCLIQSHQRLTARSDNLLLGTSLGSTVPRDVLLKSAQSEGTRQTHTGTPMHDAVATVCLTIHSLCRYLLNHCLPLAPIAEL